MSDVVTAGQVSGSTAPGFEAVRDAFAANFEQGLEVGASLAVYRHGRPVVDLWGGFADVERSRPWQRDSVTLVYSVTKGATAAVFNTMHQAGTIDLDQTVAHYWPEFAAEGKGAITVRQMLSHQAGLPALDPSLTRQVMIDGTAVEDWLAAQAPLWPPGTSGGYHALTFGWLANALVRRITGRSLGEQFAQTIAGPLGLDFWIGLPQDKHDRFAPLIDGTPDPDELKAIADPEIRAGLEAFVAVLHDPNSLLSRVLTSNGQLPAPSATSWNDPEVLAAEFPGANGVTNARSIARLYAACMDEVDGVRLYDPETLEEATAEQTSGPDEVLLGFSRFGTGYQLPQPAVPMMGPSSFGHAGVGGAIGFADRDSGISFGYAQNLLGASLVNERRANTIIAELKKCL